MTPGLALAAPAVGAMPWYAVTRPTARERRAALEAERIEVLAQAIGDHRLPYELELRLEAVDRQLVELLAPVV
jgi:hypothetical protein